MNPGGLVSDVSAGSLADEIGLEPGDRILSANGQPLRDVIDFQFYAGDELVVLEVLRDGIVHRLEIERDLDESWGISFAEPTFDGMRQCTNHCPFCFVQQMPPGLRPSLYIKDDDYRYSFLYGNYVTLTNLDESDWDRLAEQRLSPYTSRFMPPIPRFVAGCWATDERPMCASRSSGWARSASRSTPRSSSARA